MAFQIPHQEHYFQKLLDKARREGIDVYNKKSLQWLAQKAREIEDPPSRDHLVYQSLAYQGVNQPLPGKMYLFKYYAKYAQTLPYWDLYPVDFIIKITKEHVHGLNLHYLPYDLRVKLLDALYSTISSDKLYERTKLNINYQMLKSAAKFKYFKPCYKVYRKDHLLSRFVEIPPHEWAAVAMLPIEMFLKKGQRYSTKKVWEDSKKKIFG